MSRRVHTIWAVLTSAMIAFTGCSPQQPFYFHEDGDLSHYIDTATNIEYPDVEVESLDEVTGTEPPLTLDNTKPKEMWDLTLEEAMCITLANSKVMRTLGGRLTSTAQLQPPVGGAPEGLVSIRGSGGGGEGTFPSAAKGLPTIYDAAIAESAPRGGIGGGTGVEGALSAFDAQWSTQMIWQKNDRPQNVTGGIVGAFFTPSFQQDQGLFGSEISKITMSGARFAFRNNTVYDQNNNPTRQVPSDWNTNFEFETSVPLLLGAGRQFNSIFGPISPSFQGPGGPIVGALNSGMAPGSNGQGVVIARINVDIGLTYFEGGVRNLVADVENAYWDLYFDYRNLEATKAARASALQTWKKIHALYVVGARGGEAEKEAQSREQYFFFRSQVQTSLNNLYREENRLRYMMGIAVADCRLIRPADEPTTAKVAFDWGEMHSEALARSVELRQHKWQIKKDELSLIANKNFLLPRLDAIGRYRFLGLGDDLIDTDRDAEPAGGLLKDTNAFQNLTGGDFQEWQLGLLMTMPIGFRNQLAGVRNAQLVLAKDRAILQDQELELSHQLADALRNLEGNYSLSQTNFNRRVAAQRQVEAVQAAFDAETVTLDLLLDAQRRRADAEIAYYRSLTDYNRSIAQIHFRKGSLLEYNNVYLAEGPWPAKAQFDAHRLARQRDAGYYLDYGYTRPRVFSQGPYLQHADDAGGAMDEHEGHSIPTDGVPHLAPPEEVPAPAPSAPPANIIPSPQPTQARRSGGSEGPVLKQPRLRTASSARGEQFDWGTISGLSGAKAKSAPAKTAARTIQNATPAAASRLKKPTVAKSEPTAADSEEQADSSRAERASFEWKSSSTDAPAGSTSRPTTAWRATKS